MYRCYVCNAPTTQEEHQKTSAAMDALPEPELTNLVDALGLVHCTPDEAQADDSGAVVVCARCFAYGRTAF